MRPTPDPTLRAPAQAERRPRARGLVALAFAASLACVASSSHAAQPFIWDQDTNGLDDRVESVHVAGWSASFELGDTTLHQRIEVTRVLPGLLYGVYVRWDHTPTPIDLAKLTLLGMPVLSSVHAVPATRSLATFAQCWSAKDLPGVVRVEAVPLLYPETRDGSGAIGVRDPSDHIFPTLAKVVPGLQGAGVVVAFLDTGINDEAEGAYPGHQALTGRCVGGGQFVSPDSLSQTPRTGSVNPADHGGQSTQSHATHVAGIALGTGGTGGYAAGIAPLAHYVDVKVLNDSGIGVAVPEALDWCIANRTRDWGNGESGIDVVNLSLSSPDESDGQDLASELAAYAVQQGIVVVASMGNDGLENHVPSPAAGDGVIAVGAWDISRSPAPADDTWPTFNNTGPRASDDDGSSLDELKPDVLAPGVDVLSANGDVLTDGTKWKRLSGTSMAAGFVSGVCALLREAAPGASPATIAEWLRTSARRPLAGAPSGSGGADPRWRSTWGAGLVDAYAAWLEATNGPSATQLRRLTITSDDVAVTSRLETGREVGIAQLTLERAPDVGGAPGTFAAVHAFSAAGSPSLNGPNDGTDYTYVAPVPVPERGARFWYRASSVQAGVPIVTPAVAFKSPGGPRVATLEITIVHDAYDSDIEASVRAGHWTDGGPVFELPGTSAAAASDWVDGTSLTGSQAWTFVIPVPQGPASAFLPPSPGTPWTLTVGDAGSLSRSGRITDFRLTWHAPGGDQETVGEPLPRQTLEGGSVDVRTPSPTLGVDPPTSTLAARALPNPARAGRDVRLALPESAGDEARVFDVTGREVTRLALARTATGRETIWRTRDAGGHALPAGIYLVRPRHGAATRVVLLGP
jgi:hypothetical protein